MPHKSPRKGKESKDLADTDFPDRPALDRTVPVFATRTLLRMLKSRKTRRNAAVAGTTTFARLCHRPVQRRRKKITFRGGDVGLFFY